jgi:hypothetical protein
VYCSDAEGVPEFIEVAAPTDEALHALGARQGSCRLSHRVLQAAMSWTNSHLHAWKIAGRRYGVPAPDWDAPGKMLDERAFTVGVTGQVRISAHRRRPIRLIVDSVSG